jgi:hypothetical protein
MDGFRLNYVLVEGFYSKRHWVNMSVKALQKRLILQKVYMLMVMTFICNDISYGEHFRKRKGTLSFESRREAVCF